MSTSNNRLPINIVTLLEAERPDSKTWTGLVKLLDAETLSPQQLDAVKKALSSWPKEVPRPAPKHWLPSAYRATPPTLALCLDVAENEQLYNYYVTSIAASPRLRLRDGSPAVSLWRQMRGRVHLQNGTSLALGEGQPGLADLGGVMVVEWDAACPYCEARPKQFHSCLRDSVGYRPRRLSVYVEAEVKLDGKLPPQCREYRGTSTRQLTDTERDQVQRQQAQLARGGCYIFCERTEELVDGLVTFRDDVVARLS